MTLGTPEERFQLRFAPLLVRARAIPPAMYDVFNQRHPEGVRGDALPEATVARLLYGVVPIYHTAVQSLAEPETSLGALALLRSVIDAWACLHFIAGHDALASARCRAVRVELGWADQAIALAKAAGPVMAAEVAIAEQRKRDIADIASELGCAVGKPWGYKNAGPTVKALARERAVDWLPGAWSSAAQMVHVGGFDWSLVDGGDGANVMVLPSPSHRAHRLNHLVVGIPPLRGGITYEEMPCPR